MKAEMPPPSYTETSGKHPTAGDPAQNVPPTYDSIFGKAKAMKEESSGNFDFAKKFLAFMVGSVGCTIFLGIVLALPIAMIVIGAKYLDDCPEERMIPIWLLVSGSFGLFRNLVSIVQRCAACAKKKNEDAELGDAEEQEKSCASKLCQAFDSLLSCFMAAWFIAGNVWVYRSKGDISSDSNAVNYCHPTVYWFSFWLITCSYILIGVIFFCCCFCCICLICCIGKKAASASNQPA